MTEPRKILIIQLRRIGDVILTSSASSALQRRYPLSKIDFLVEPPAAEAVRGLPFISEVVVYNVQGPLQALRQALAIRARRYDCVIDFMGNPRTALLTALSGAPIKAGPAHVFHRWAYTVLMPQSQQTVYAAREKIRMLAAFGVADEQAPLPVWPGMIERKTENLVGLIPASRKATRRWPAEHYAELGRMLRDRYGCGIIVFWGPGERELAVKIARDIGFGAKESLETTSLQAAAEQLSRCRLVVSNCCGPKHMAVALGVPTVTVHASSDPAAWNPPHPRHLVARRDELHCIGCRRNDCPYALECLNGLSPVRVFNACAKLLEAA